MNDPDHHLAPLIVIAVLAALACAIALPLVWSLA